MNPIRISPAVDAIREAVARASGSFPGAATYLVGGSVRDRLMSREPKDHDLMITGIPLADLKALLPGRVNLVGESFSVLKVTLGAMRDNGMVDETVDVALPRREQSTGTGHRQFTIEGDPNLPVDQDLARRDFTMNAIALRLDDGTLSDPFGGQEDIHSGIIRAVGDATWRFCEDPLRMLRAARFCASAGFAIEWKTFEAMRAHADLVLTVAKERVVDELLRMLSVSTDRNRSVVAALRLLRDTGLLARVCPPFAASIGFVQNNPHHHLTVDEHVFAAVGHAVQRDARIQARLAVLLHDVGKPTTYTVGDDGVGHFYGHEEVGAEMVRKWMATMPFPLNNVPKLVLEHLRPQKDVSDKALRRWIAEMDADWEDALACREADMAAHAGADAAQHAQEWADGIRARVAEIGTDVQGFDERRLALSGTEIASRFGVKGRDIGVLKRIAAQAVIDGELANEPVAISDWLTKHCTYVRP